MSHLPAHIAAPLNSTVATSRNAFAARALRDLGAKAAPAPAIMSRKAFAFLTLATFGAALLWGAYAFGLI